MVIAHFTHYFGNRDDRVRTMMIGMTSFDYLIKSQSELKSGISTYDTYRFIPFRETLVQNKQGLVATAAAPCFHSSNWQISMVDIPSITQL